MANLLFKNINKIYPNNVQAVFDFNLEVKDKEFIVFVGPSGCGKSTTLRMIAGLEDITSGQLFIDGAFINNTAPKDRDIAMVFQSYALYPHMSVYRNMAFALKLRKIKFPLYEPNEEINKIRENNYELFRQIKQINRKIKKHNESEELLLQRDELYEEIFAAEEKIKSLSKPIVGINYLEIEQGEKKLAKLKERLAKNKKECDSYISELEKANAILPSLEEGQKKEKEEEYISQLNLAIKIFQNGIEQKEQQIKSLEDELEYYRNNEVPLTVYRKHNAYEIDLEVYKASKILDLGRYLFRKPAALSGGQRQRVALGRAIVRKPKVFLMDEPLSNLDAKLRVQTREEISKIHERVGATTIYVTHDQTEALTMADRIVIMKDGYVQQIGAPNEVYNNPVNMFVAGFIGSPSMNFLKGHYEDGYFVLDGEEDIKIKLNATHQKLLKGHEENIVLGVRPENVTLKGDLTNEEPSSDLKGTCDYAELLGYELVIYTYVNGQKILLKAPAKTNIEAGNDITFNLDEKVLYFFDGNTSERIK